MRDDQRLKGHVYRERNLVKSFDIHIFNFACFWAGLTAIWIIIIIGIIIIICQDLDKSHQQLWIA